MQHFPALLTDSTAAKDVPDSVDLRESPLLAMPEPGTLYQTKTCSNLVQRCKSHEAGVHTINFTVTGRTCGMRYRETEALSMLGN
eukprot:scaffold4189_cov378-Prasinococcus_capsulatus_cf.AAC.4